MKGLKAGQGRATPQRPTSGGRTPVQRPTGTARLHETTRDGWSDVPFDQQAACAPDNPNESTFSEYATGRLIREATSLHRLGELLEGMPEPLGPKNASLALEKFALLGSSVSSGSAHAMRVVGGPGYVLAICKGVADGQGERAPPHAAVTSRSLWALAELANVAFLDGSTLLDRKAPEVQGFLAHCVATCDSQQCNARDACAMLWALGVLQPRLTPELAAFVGDLVDVVDGSVEAPLLQLRDWADMLWAIATLAGQRQGSPFGPFGQHNAAAVLQRSHPLTLALREHQAAAKRASSDGVRPEDAHPPRAETAAHRQDARLVEASESIVRQASAAIGRLSSFDPARFKRLSADTVVALLTSFAALGIPKKEFHGPELLCKLSTRRMRSGHMQALSRPPQLAAAAAAASAIRASDRPAQIGSAPAEGDWAERFCGAIDAAICKHLAGVHLRMSPSSPPSTWARAARPRSRAPEGESATERAQRAGLEALSESVRDIEAQVGVATGESAEARQAAARRADEAQELAELCVHAASVAQSLAACGMQPSATLGLAVQPMLGTLLEQGDALGECSPAMSQLLGGVQGAAWTEREAQAAVTREAVQQLGGITCAPPA